MQVRDADPQRDAAGCTAIYAPYVSATAVSLEEVVPTAEEIAARIERVSAAYPWLVAEQDGEVTGFAYATRNRERASYRWAADVSVYVADAHHRHGIARALYETLFELLRAQNLRMAVAGITVPNPASIALHEALGFRSVGIYRRIGYKLGAWQDVGWWQLDLDPGSTEAPAELGRPARLPAPVRL